MAEKWLKDVFTLIVGEFGGKMLRDLFRGELREGAGVIAERIRTLIKENPRADLVFLLFSMDPSEAAALWQRYRQVKGTTEENSFAVTLGQLLQRRADGSFDTERAGRLLGELAQLNEETFSDVMEFLKHDPIAQHLRPWLKRAFYVAGRLDHACEQLAQKLQPTAERLRQEAEPKGWWRSWTDC